MARRPAFHPGFEALGGLLQVRQELFILPLLAKLRNGRFGQLPNPEEFAGGLKEEVFVQQSVIQQGAGLLPIGKHHHCESPAFGAGGGDAHGVVQVLHKIILEEPVAGLPQPRLAPLFEELQLKLCLFMCRFCCHDSLSPFLFFSLMNGLREG